MMRQRKKLRDIIGIIKDRASLFRAAFLSKCSASSLCVAVLRATTHDPSTPPPEHYVAAVLDLGNASRYAASACVETIMERLHNTKNAAVALKCLFLLYRVASGGSFILRDQLSVFPSDGGRNFLNLSTFRQHSDPESWELSTWVRWFAGVLEQKLTAYRVLGSYLYSFSRTADKAKQAERLVGQLSSELLKDVDTLVGVVEQICEAPKSLHLQINNLVYEVVKLVGEDYRLAQLEILPRIAELDDRVSGLSSGESAELMSILKRLEECRERLSLLFVNRKKNDSFWDSMRRTKTKLVDKEKEERERWKLGRIGWRDESSELTRYAGRVSGSEQLFRLSSGGAWLDADRVALTVSAVR